MESEIYYKELEKYKDLSNEIIKSGGAYLVVIASHELYRFLYPYEPYEDIALTKPIEFIVAKIKSVNSWLEISKKMICFYDFDLRNYEKNSQSIEQDTSDLYTSLWNKFNDNTIVKESKELVEKRLPKEIIENCIKDKVILDMGCGSGRYSIALSLMGAKKVYGIDLFKQSYQVSEKISKEKNLNIEFCEGNFHSLPFEKESFDFVFCNGTIHHSTSIEKSLVELRRVLKKGSKSFLYIYADGGIFWNTRKVMREVFQNIPSKYTDDVLKVIGLPLNRFIFSDVWHVPIETHTSNEEIENLLRSLEVNFKKIISKNQFDLDYAIDQKIEGALVMWGDGEHRYILEKNND